MGTTDTTKNTQQPTTTTSTTSDPPVLTSAPPPWHSVAVLTAFIAVFIKLLPSVQSLDDVATMETFTHRVFPQYVSVRQLALARAVIATAIWCTSIHTVFLSNGWDQRTAYVKGSKLKTVPNRLVGIKTMFPFTAVSWNLLGAAFTLSSYIAYQASNNTDTTTTTIIIMRVAIILWEIAAPFTLLVAAVIRYAIWPAVLGAFGDTVELKSTRNVMMHNMNVIFALVEVSLLGSLPVRWSDCSMAPLVGCAYVLFTWNVTHIWNDQRHGPQFIYFFFDTTLPKMATTALLVLLMVLIVFYAIFCGAEAFLRWMDGGVILHVLFVILISTSVMRFRD